jgi:hypothetical protein
MFVPPRPKRNKAKVVSLQPRVLIAPKSFQPMPSHEQISLRAYEIYQRGGYADGRDQQDWLQAEREMFAIQE